MNHEERQEYVPAARCRGCQVITWEVSVAHGLRRTDATHEQGCTAPPGKFDLLRDARQLVEMGEQLERMEAQEHGQDEAEQD